MVDPLVKGRRTEIPPDPRLARIGRTFFWAVPPAFLAVAVVVALRGDAWAAWTSAMVALLWPYSELARRGGRRRIRRP